MAIRKILITGSSGFIGNLICSTLSCKYKVVALYNKTQSIIENEFDSISTDLAEFEGLDKICQSYVPDLVIHCAGIADQRTAKVKSDIYMRINCSATENLANAAIQANPDVYFLFLSSTSLYGEADIKGSISEEDQCNPASDYAFSKLYAEKRLVGLYNEGLLKKLDILRLAPVYDSECSINMDKRVFAPKKLIYLKFGSGEQEMSAVSRQNLVDFIEYRLNQTQDNSTKDSFCNIFNICDEKPYKFKEITRIFRKSDCQPNRLVVTVPLAFVWAITRIAGFVFKNKQQWLYSCYDKVKYSLVVDNSKMLATGFKHKHSLKSVFLGK